MSRESGAGLASDALRQLLLLAGLRRIFLHRYALSCSIGIHAFERRGPQRLFVDIDLYVRPRPAGDADAIDTVLDYDFLRAEIAELAASRHFELQETLLEAIAGICLAKPQVLAARVSTEKPDVYPDCAAVGVELFVARDDLGLPAALFSNGPG
ncbi:dihydroneopterin aldolase [Constrictibacter sp. MBR-5]|jgi:dihydroneopterin aldolase|uniref:dihydroneopterin aldolase n=1 Tax=Constrictibacter sp. MBR-5 TaxID=3156467 RepID=UPI003398C136